MVFKSVSMTALCKNLLRYIDALLSHPVKIPTIGYGKLVCWITSRRNHNPLPSTLQQMFVSTTENVFGSCLCISYS